MNIVPWDAINKRVISSRASTILNSYALQAWTEPDISATILDRIGPFATIPMRCLGKGRCSTKETCEMENVDSYVDKACPIEQELAKHLFFSFVSNLGILPQDYTDITVVWHLVRLSIHMRRFDIKLSTEDIMRKVVVGVNPETGTVLENEQPHPALIGQERLLKDMLSLYGKLVATRADKLKAAAQGAYGGVDTVAAMARIKEIMSS